MLEYGMFILIMLMPFGNAENLNISTTGLIQVAENHTAKVDYESRALALIPAMKSYGLNKVEPSGFLCSTFVKWDSSTVELLAQNINHTYEFCDWLIIAYDSQEKTNLEMEFLLGQQLSKFYNDELPRSNLFAIRTAPHKADSMEAFLAMCESYSRNYVDQDYLSANDPCSFLAVPQASTYNPSLYSKASLFMLTLEFLPKYKYIWALDSDIDLQNLDLKRFFLIMQCSFKNPPLVSQPLIHESTQFYRYLHRGSWKNVNAFATAVGFIEIQAPIFYSSFLQYFILAFIVPLIPAMLVLGADWGIDEMFCSAAQTFLKHNGKGLRDQPVCAVVLNDIAVNHRNQGEIAKSVGLETKRQLNFGLMGIVHRYFGKFCHDGLRYYNDPFNFGTHYKRIYKLREDCSI